MKYLGKTKVYMWLQIEHLNNDIFVYQQIYITKVLKQFDMNKSNLLCIRMIVMSFNMNKDYVMPHENDEQLELVLLYHISFQLVALMYFSKSMVKLKRNDICTITLWQLFDKSLFYDHYLTKELFDKSLSWSLFDPHV